MRRLLKQAGKLALAGGFLAALTSTGIAQAANDVPGVSKDEILVGHLGPETGPVAAYDVIRKAITSYFNYVNDHGGVDGRQLKLVSYDDQYQPAKTVRLIRRLVEEDHVFAMIANVGSPSISAIQNYVEKKGTPMIMNCSGAKQFFDPPIANFMGACSGGYEIEAKVMPQYVIDELGDKRIAIAYQNDDYGTPIKDAMAKVIKAHPDAELVETVSFQAGDADFSSQAQKLRNAKPDAILVAAIMGPTTHLKKALYSIGITSDNTDYMTSAEGGENTEAFSLAGGQAWEGTYSLTVTSADDGAKSDQVKLFHKQFSKDYPKTAISGSAKTSWAAAQVFVEALKRTEPLTQENFLKSFYTFDNWDGSLYVGISFDKNNHYGVTSMYVTRAEDGEIRRQPTLITFDPATDTATITDTESAH